MISLILHTLVGIKFLHNLIRFIGLSILLSQLSVPYTWFVAFDHLLLHKVKGDDHILNFHLKVNIQMQLSLFYLNHKIHHLRFHCHNWDFSPLFQLGREYFSAWSLIFLTLTFYLGMDALLIHDFSISISLLSSSSGSISLSSIG